MARKLKNSSEEQSSQEQSSEEQLGTNFASQDVAIDSYNRSRCGGALNQARQVQGLSVQDVASKLRLSPKQIEAIEADDFAKLPESTIVRGFIRNYAKLLKINAEPLLDAYSAIVPTSVQHQLTVKPTSNMQVTSGDKPKPSSYILIGFVLVMALGAWLFYQNYVQKPSPIKPSATVEDMDLEPLPEPALPAAERACNTCRFSCVSYPCCASCCCRCGFANKPTRCCTSTNDNFARSHKKWAS
jgi:cytoskeleton protein RodZ